MKNNRWAYLVLLLVVLTLSGILYFRFPEFIYHINSYVTALDGDGLKNYYTFLYYAKWGQGDAMMNGMAYPYGEHIVYTDGQPALAFVLYKLQHWGLDLTQYSVGIMNGLMLSSILTVAVFIFLIIKKIGLPNWYAFVVTIIITLLSPQIDRMNGHFALSSVFLIPMIWYFLIRSNESQKSWIWYSVIFIVMMIHGFLHPYYLPLSAFFLLSYALVYCLQYRHKFKEIKNKLISIVLLAILPAIVFQLWMKVTDTVSGRPNNPSGILNYHSSFESVFIPPNGPMHLVVDSFYPTTPEWEGTAFVGSAATLVLFFTIIRIYKRVRKKEVKKIFSPPLPEELKSMIWAAVIVLIVSMAYPFRLGMDWLLDLIPALKQFRSLGRFVWIFYYVFTVYAAYYLYTIYRLLSERHKQFGVIFILIVLLSWSADAWLSFIYSTRGIKELKENVFVKDLHYREELKKNNLTDSSFQAILPLPFFIGGTEKIDTYEAHFGFHPFAISYASGLPMFAVMSARVPLQHAKDLKQLLSADEIEKSILKKVNQKPILIVHAVNEKLCPEEVRFLKKCKLLGHIEGMDLYQLDIKQLQTKDSIVKEYEERKHLLISEKGYSYTRMPNVIYRNSFEDKPSAKSFVGKGALVMESDYHIIIDNFTLPVQEDSVSYELSLWMYLDPEIYPGANFTLNRYNEDGSHNSVMYVWQTDSYDIYNDWVRISFKFTSNKKNERLKLDCSVKGIVVDELVLKPLDADVYYEVTDSSFMKNNYLIIK